VADIYINRERETNWLAGWLADWPAGCLVDWLAGWLAAPETDFRFSQSSTILTLGSGTTPIYIYIPKPCNHWNCIYIYINPGTTGAIYIHIYIYTQTLELQELYIYIYETRLPCFIDRLQWYSSYTHNDHDVTPSNEVMQCYFKWCNCCIAALDPLSPSAPQPWRPWLTGWGSQHVCPQTLKSRKAPRH
jgi:hypothetical protein